MRIIGSNVKCWIHYGHSANVYFLSPYLLELQVLDRFPFVY